MNRPPDAAGGPAALDEATRARVQRRTLTVVIMSQVLGGAGLAAGVTVGALLAQEMLGSDGLAGLPAGLFTLGSALTAYLVGRVTQRSGRRVGLGAGFAAGAAGALGVVLAAVVGSPALLFGALFVYGAGTATNLQARYAGTDLALPARRGQAISIAMVSTTLGAVAGPNLVTPMGRFAVGLGIPALAGPFLLAGAAYLAAGVVLLVLLRPDPFLLARRLNAKEADDDAAAAGAGAPVPTPARPGNGVYVGAAVMVLTQIAMVAIMTMTPVHMRFHHHSLADVGLVIGIHIGAMYLPSLVTGVLVDRVGRLPMAAAAGGTLLLAGVTAALAPGESLGLLILALALLGLGWNFGLIAGTALVVDNTAAEIRPQVQGRIDVLVALAGAGGGMLSGVVMAGTGYAALALSGGILALLLIPVLLWARRSAVVAAPGR
ncbi:MFS transporter [Arthrobacter gengyunqii]|uniref:MFS transporter n=1 Tax=Arthrobacter gengyunqii TaxID=2886940 RepID=A0A9X1M2W9_9MICC|nr:MFS transporter [Arthrobacter gengyunqii]MCC3270354.1 MFS transporter [Arthrobacter gengyunqii]UOY97547.1 MFS transporter [Arthrobacter gengyunqii]